jgi:hypothetical protein
VTIDAKDCQTAIAKTIIEKGGDYLLAVNIETGHGRIENQICYVLSSAELEGHFLHWHALKSIVMVENFRIVKGKALSLEYRDYTSSKELSAKQVLSATRKPWGIGCQHERR